jgi:hypothetical protein
MDFRPPPSDLALYLNGLSLLFNVYLSQKPGVAAKLEELIKELRALKPSAQPQTRHELDKRLEEKLLPEVGPDETEAVKRDLDLVAVFSEPIRVEDFDYLSTVTSYGSKYAALADKASLFDLRGVVEEESLLLLPTAASHLLKPQDAPMLLRSSGYPSILEPIKVTEINAVLTRTGQGFGLTFSVFGTFKGADHVHYTTKTVSRGCRYILAAEGRKNWITLQPRGPVAGFEGIVKRLHANEVLNFMQAVRADVMKYVLELREETSLIKGSISSLLQEVTQFFDEKPE